MQRDSVGGTFTVAAILCVVCSVIVSSAAVGLRPIQLVKKAEFEKKNILLAAGLIDEGEVVSSEQINDTFADNITVELVDLDTGKPATSEQVAEESYDQRAAAKDPQLSSEANGLSSIARRERYSFVYLINKGGKTQLVVLPVYGKGLWSTLYGFLALERDAKGKLNQIAGLTFYSHQETPGLGGEVDNPEWKKKWRGKSVRGADGTVQLAVIKGVGKSDFEVDGLSGATITSNGVTNTIQYWMSDEGFGKFLANIE